MPCFLFLRGAVVFGLPLRPKEGVKGVLSHFKHILCFDAVRYSQTFQSLFENVERSYDVLTLKKTTSFDDKHPCLAFFSLWRTKTGATGARSSRACWACPPRELLTSEVPRSQQRRWLLHYARGIVAENVCFLECFFSWSSSVSTALGKGISKTCIGNYGSWCWYRLRLHWNLSQRVLTWDDFWGCWFCSVLFVDLMFFWFAWWEELFTPPRRVKAIHTLAQAKDRGFNFISAIDRLEWLGTGGLWVWLVFVVAQRLGTCTVLSRNKNDIKIEIFWDVSWKENHHQRLCLAFRLSLLSLMAFITGEKDSIPKIVPEVTGSMGAGRSTERHWLEEQNHHRSSKHTRFNHISTRQHYV